MPYADVKRYRIPVGPADMTPEIMGPMKQLFLNALDVEWFHDGNDYFWRMFSGPLVTIPANPALPNQRWRLRARSQAPSKFLTLATDASGKVLSRSVIADPSGGNNSLETFMAPGKMDPGTIWQWVVQGGITWTNFCAEYGGWFNRVPALAWADTGSAYSPNFNPDPTAGWTHIPLGIPTDPAVNGGRVSSWPTGWFPMFDLETGVPCLVSLDSFAQNMAKKAPGTGPATTASVKYKLTDPVFMGQIARSLSVTTPDDARLGNTLLTLAREQV